MPPIRLRIPSTNDAEFVYSVYEATARHLVEGVGRRWAETKMREKAELEVQDGFTRIIESDGEDVGFFSLEETASEFWLHALFLQPRYQGQGIGMRLMREAMAQAEAKRMPIRLQVMTFNPAVAFYERLGLKINREEDRCFFMQSAA